MTVYDIRDHLGQSMTPPDKFGYDGGYIAIEGKRYILIYQEDAPEYPPFPCQDTGFESHPPHDWQGDWPTTVQSTRAEGWFRCPGWRGSVRPHDEECASSLWKSLACDCVLTEEPTA